MAWKYRDVYLWLHGTLEVVAAVPMGSKRQRDAQARDQRHHDRQMQHDPEYAQAERRKKLNKVLGECALRKAVRDTLRPRPLKTKASESEAANAPVAKQAKAHDVAQSDERLRRAQEKVTKYNELITNLTGARAHLAEFESENATAGLEFVYLSEAQINSMRTKIAMLLAICTSFAISFKSLRSVADVPSRMSSRERFPTANGLAFPLRTTMCSKFGARVVWTHG